MPPPKDMTDVQKDFWKQLAPLAAIQRTLTTETAHAFRDLCEAIVLKRLMLEQINIDGLTMSDEDGVVKAHPLITHHRGLMQRVEAGLMRFRLSPVGKEMAPVDTPKDEWDDLDDGTGSVN